MNYNNENGAAALLTTIIFTAIVMSGLTYMLSRSNSQKLVLQSGQYAREIDHLEGAISYFLSNPGTCSANFNGDYSSNTLQPISVPMKLISLDASTRFETISSNPTYAYEQNRIQIADISLSGFQVDPANPTSGLGVGQLNLTFQVLNGLKKIGYNKISRTIPMSLQLDAGMNLIGCSSSAYSDRYWQQSPLGAYYSPSPMGKVGVGTFSPNFTLDIGQDGFDSMKTSVGGNLFNIGSTTAGKLSYLYDTAGPTFKLAIEAGNSFLFAADPTLNPVIIRGQTIAVNYPAGLETTGITQVKSTDATPWLGLRTDSTGAHGWNFQPDPSTPGDLYIAPKAPTGTSELYICHFMNSGSVCNQGEVSAMPFEHTDFRIGSQGLTQERPNLNLSLTVFGNSQGTTPWVTTSDERLKENVRPLKDSLAAVKKLNGYYFNWKNPELGKAREMGLVAQELIENHVAEDLVDCSGSICTLQYAPLTALLVESTKQINEMQMSLEDRIKWLKNKNSNSKD